MPKNVNAKGRRIKGSFTAIPDCIHESDAYRSLDGWAARLLLDIAAQYKGRNNGDLQASFTRLKKYGWPSKSTISRAVKKLLEVGLIEVTRQAKLRNTCKLYAITWQPIDECKNRLGHHKLDVSPTKLPSNQWKTISSATGGTTEGE